MLQKIESVWGSVSLNDQGHSPCPICEDLLQQLYAYDRLQYGIQFSKNLEFPLTVVIGITGMKRRRTCTQKVTKKA
jgi:hypothetical protein